MRHPYRWTLHLAFGAEEEPACHHHRVKVMSVAFIAHEQVIETVQNCGPFGCKDVEVVNAEATAQLRAEEPLGRFNGLGTYTNGNHLAFEEVGAAWNGSDGFGDFANRVLNLPFYKALAFTLTYTFVVTPLVIVLGFMIA